MQQKNIRTAQCLTYAGTLPLIMGSVAIAIGSQLFDYAHACILYGAMIASFLCGIHWAVYLFYSESSPVNLLFTSNAVTLIIWAALLAVGNSANLLVQALCFAALLLIDRMLYNKTILPDWFYRLRRNATTIVIIAQLAITCLI